MNPVNEEFDRAYTNVGLFANNVWSFQKEINDFRKANLNLWIRFNEIEQRLVQEYSDDGKSTSTEEVIRTVKDTIPNSLLASYNDYYYDEERENMYISDDEPAQYIPNSLQIESNVALEEWMLPEVEEEFKRLTHVSSSRWCSISPRIPTGRELVPMRQVITANPYQWLTQTTWPDQLLTRYPDLPRAMQDSKGLSLFREDLNLQNYDGDELEEKVEEFPCPRYLIETGADLELHTRIDSLALRGLWATSEFHYGDFSPCYGLNAEVPEFQPVAPRQQPYPCIYDTSYEAELFPYTLGYKPHPENLFPNIYSIEAQPIPNLPVFLSPPESYFNIESTESTCSPMEGVLHLHSNPEPGSEECVAIMESKHQLKPYRNVETFPFHAFSNSSSNKPPSAQKMLAFLEKWLSKIYNPRSNDFRSIASTSCKIDNIFKNVHQNIFIAQHPVPTAPALSVSVVEAVVPSLTPSLPQKPLYSDVLMNEVRASTISSPVNESKYDQLEREALEQYSFSPKIKKPPQPFSPPGCIQPQPTQSTFWEARSPLGGITLPEHFSQRKSPASTESSNLPSTGSKRSSVEDHSQNFCSPSKQAMWMKNKKKKPEKKKKSSKKKNKPVREFNSKNLEAEILLINKYLRLNNIFENIFFKGDWTLVKTFLTNEAENSFLDSLKIVKEGLGLFKMLTMDNNLEEDFRSNEKRLDVANGVVDTLHETLGLLHWYICRYSQIKLSIPCDHRLYYDPTKMTIPCKPHLFQQQHDFVFKALLNEMDYTQFLEVNNTITNSRYNQKLFNHPEEQQTSVLISKREWKLGSVRLTLQPPTRNVVRIVDDGSIWHSLQWRFCDGWAFEETNTRARYGNSLCGLNQFDASSLEKNALFSYRTLNNWVNDCIDTVFSNQLGSTYALLWSLKMPMIAYNSIYTQLLLKREEGWCLREVRIDKRTSFPLMVGYYSTGRDSWLLYDGSTRAFRQDANKTSGKVKPSISEKDDLKNTRTHLKSIQKVTDRLPPDNQLILKNFTTSRLISKNIEFSQEEQLKTTTSCVLH